MQNELNGLTEKGKDLFSRITGAAKRMQALIDDLLAYSRTASFETNFKTRPLTTIIEEVMEDLKEQIDLKNATIENLGNCEVSIIPFQFRQLMQNLFTNAMKFVESGQSPHIKVVSEIITAADLPDLQLEPANAYCHISVSDNGIGFAPEYAEKIFELFQRLHGKSQFSGTGIGLAIVKKIVENHHGVIVANSEPHKGATFNIYLPHNV